MYVHCWRTQTQANFMYYFSFWRTLATESLCVPFFFSISHAFSLTCSFADKMHTHQSCLIDFLFSSGFFSLCIFPFRLVWPRALRSKHFLVPFVCVALSGRSLIYIEFTIHPHSHTITSMHTLRDYCLFDEWFGCLCMPHIRWLYCFIT